LPWPIPRPPCPLALPRLNAPPHRQTTPRTRLASPRVQGRVLAGQLHASRRLTRAFPTAHLRAPRRPPVRLCLQLRRRDAALAGRRSLQTAQLQPEHGAGQGSREAEDRELRRGQHGHGVCAEQ
ncbi:hypothetical protein LTR16_010082, partial [Cryomyces antarcticus]